MDKKKKDWKRLGNFFCTCDDEPSNKSATPEQNMKRKVSSEENQPAQIHRRKTSSDEEKNNIPLFITEPRLQYSASKDQTPVDLVIGLDIGTAWTKVVIQDVSRRRAIAIPFNEYGSKDNRFLLPTRVGVSGGYLNLCKNDDIKTICTDLKLSLIERPYQQIVSSSGKELPVTYCELAAIFIGLVLRYIRNMFIDKQSQIYRNNYLRWQLNVGIPVKNYDAEEIKEAFYKATLAGWWLSEKRGEISLLSSKEAFRKIDSKDFQPGIQREFINVVPEVAAEVAGYAYSDLREEGLHLLVDIGATTLDVSTFLLNTKAGDNRYGFLAADIGRYGAFELHKARIKSFENLMNDWLTKAQGISETLEPIPESCDHLIPKRSDILNLDTRFIEQAAVPITRVIAKTKKDRYPKAEEWSTGLPLFICGGGRMAKFYSDKLINHVKSTMNKSIIWKGFRIKEIPKPDNLEAEELRSHEYHRLAVAYGLSFQFDDIGIIVPPSEIDDVPRDRPNKNIYDKFISKDQV